MQNEYLPSTYESVFGNLSAEEIEQMNKDDIPVPVIVGESEVTEEDKKIAEEFLKQFRNK